MALHKVHGFVTFEPPRYGDKEPTISFKTYDPRQFNFEGAVVSETDIEVEVPDDFDPRPSMVAHLTAQKQKVRAELAARIRELDEQINRLLALEMAQ